VIAMTAPAPDGGRRTHHDVKCVTGLRISNGNTVISGPTVGVGSTEPTADQIYDGLHGVDISQSAGSWGIIAMLRSLARCARRNAHPAIIVALALSLVGCASRPGPEVLVPVAAAPGAKSASLYVATARKRDTPSQNVFTAERANTLNFA